MPFMHGGHNQDTIMIGWMITMQITNIQIFKMFTWNRPVA